ncbi:MAG: thioesterase II family protein [Dyella sp.]|uniref:thioesterase II family protein n=1 Tax=Dyella sp. TaxID=1869338 RepID=UPI003F7D6A3A
MMHKDIDPRLLRKWTLTWLPNSAATARVFCFPYAGSGASVFRDWQPALSNRLEVVGIQLPGRENRFLEKRLNRLDAAIDALLDVIPSWLDKPFFFFGHSLGALLAFELARAMQQRGLPAPFHIVVSGSCAPHRRHLDEPLHILDDAQLLERIRDYNGTPPELLHNDEVMRLLLPQMREDFAMFETWEHRDDTPVNCPLTALGGDADREVPIEDLRAWSQMTSAEFEHHLFPGDHFFIHSNKTRVLQLLRAVAERYHCPLDLESQS